MGDYVFETWGAYRVLVSPLLGDGSTSKVYLAECDGKPFALKRYLLSDGSAEQRAFVKKAASAEMLLMQPLSHPHV